MKRLRRLIRGGLVLLALATILLESAEGQQDSALVVILTSEKDGPYGDVAEGFQAYLETHDPDTAVETYYLDSRNHAEVFDAIRQVSPSALLTIGNHVTNLTLVEVSGVPLVAGLVVDLEAVRNAPNATGVALEFSPETSLRWLRRILPDHRSVGVLYDPEHNQRAIEAADAVASDMDLQILAERVVTPRDIRVALDQIARRSDVLWGIPDATVLSPRTAQQVLLFSFRKQIPFVGLSAAWVKAGALYALDRDYRDVGAQCGELVIKILRGTPPQALPPQTPRTTLYDVNLKTARQLQLSLPADVIDGAREVIQ